MSIQSLRRTAGACSVLAAVLAVAPAGASASKLSPEAHQANQATGITRVCSKSIPSSQLVHAGRCGQVAATRTAGAVAVRYQVHTQLAHPRMGTHPVQTQLAHPRMGTHQDHSNVAHPRLRTNQDHSDLAHPRLRTNPDHSDLAHPRLRTNQDHSDLAHPRLRT